MVNAIQQVVRWLAPKPSAESVIQSVIANGLSYLDEPALQELCEQVELLERHQRPGILIEAGCALGGSAIVMAIAKSRWRSFYIYDVAWSGCRKAVDEYFADKRDRYEFTQKSRLHISP